MHHRLTPEAAKLPFSSTDVSERGLYDHCSITHGKWRHSGKKGFQPASSLPLLPPASPHLPLPTGFSSVFSDFCGSTRHCLGAQTTPVKSRESCKCTWICNIFFSDSLWTGRGHFNQDGEYLHSSFWKGLFWKNHPDFLLLLRSPTGGPEVLKHTQTITAGSHCSCLEVRQALKGDNASNLQKCRLRKIMQMCIWKMVG